MFHINEKPNLRCRRLDHSQVMCAQDSHCRVSANCSRPNDPQPHQYTPCKNPFSNPLSFFSIIQLWEWLSGHWFIQELAKRLPSLFEIHDQKPLGWDHSLHHFVMNFDEIWFQPKNRQFTVKTCSYDK